MAEKKSKIKIGDRFGKLKVVDRVEVPTYRTLRYPDGKTYKEKTGTKRVWLCKCDCGGEIKLDTTTLKTERTTIRSCNECPPEKNPNYIPNKMTFEEEQDWDELYQYVRKNIMGYDENQRLPSYIVVRLQGLLKGKYMASNKTLDSANYSYKTVLNTFKYCSPDIYRALRNGGFNGEQHKVNYIFKIVENNINDVYMREQNAKRAKEKAETMAIDIIDYTGAKYQRKTKDVTNKLLEDLW